MEMEQNQAEIEQTLTKHCWDTTGLQCSGLTLTWCTQEHLVAKKMASEATRVHAHRHGATSSVIVFQNKGFQEFSLYTKQKNRCCIDRCCLLAPTSREAAILAPLKAKFIFSFAILS